MNVMRSKRVAHGHVYVISASNGYLKIGSTGGNPFERFGIAKTYSMFPLRLAYVCQCSDPVGIEDTAHKLVVEHHRHGEWFELPVERAIEVIRSILGERGATFRPADRRELTQPGSRMGRKPVHYADVSETTLGV